MDFCSVYGKVVIVTGAGSGIGQAIAEVFAENGMCVVCADYNVDAGNSVVEQICANGGVATFVKADCSNAIEVKKIIDKAIECYGKLDGIVNNAGIGMGGTPLHEYSIEDYEKIFALNSEGVFAGMKYGVEAILKTKSTKGFIINIASIAGLVPQRGQALYTATKFGVVGMTQVAALDYAQYGITVNAICPGYTKTNIFGEAPQAAIEHFASDCPAGRLGNPEECANLALFLASDLSRYISGAAIPVDGALAAGHQNVIQWKHPELVTGGGLSADSTIATIIENKQGREIVNRYLPGFVENEQVKAAYGMTFAELAPMFGLPENALQNLLEALNQL